MKKRKKKNKYIRPVLFCIFLCMFVFSGYQLVRIAADKKASNDAYEYLKTEVIEVEPERNNAYEPVWIKTKDFTKLIEINSDIKGWIKQEGSVIDYPVLRGSDNDYYLTHIYTGAYNINGSIFMDYRNSGDFSDKNTVLYGHHMRDGSMFQKLMDYKIPGYYEEHKTMMLYTPQGDYLIELISGTIEDGQYEYVRFDFSSTDEFLRYIDYFRGRSTFESDVIVNPNDRIISLCTCSFEWNNARYMVMGKLTPIVR